MNDIEWMDATRVGSLYEEQVDAANGRWRHRRIGFAGAYYTGIKADYEWKSGKAPDHP